MCLSVSLALRAFIKNTECLQYKTTVIFVNSGSVRQLNEELQATGGTPPTSQPGNQLLPLSPAHRLMSCAA